jgi:hypothetical protein
MITEAQWQASRRRNRNIECAVIVVFILTILVPAIAVIYATFFREH